MAIEFEFTVDEGFDFLQAFADRFNLKEAHNQVNIPDTLGSGYIKEVYLDNGLKLCFHQYTLNQSFILKRLASSPHDVLAIKFDRRRISTGQNGDPYTPLYAHNNDYAVEMATSNLFTEVVFSRDQEINYLVITVRRQALLDLLQLRETEHSLWNTLKHNQSFVFNEDLTPDMERILISLTLINEHTTLAPLLYQTKTLELLYLLFAQLLTRSSGSSIPINQADAEKIYALRATMLADLKVKPQLAAMARSIGMSETKMKRLFRQVFGDSIYNYYQAARMNEAARLLIYLSVSETGYELGFTNLSHFSRLFKKHNQMNPKQFQDTLSLV